MTATAAARVALADAVLRPFWTDRPDAPEPSPLTGPPRADLVVVGGGLTGLWTALEATAAQPGRDVLLLEAHEIGSGASGRNGGFVSASLTHGHAHGLATWPGELPALVRLGRENLTAIAATLAAEGVDADLRLTGKSLLATREHELPALAAAHRLHVDLGEDAELLDAASARADVASPTYLGALRVRTGSGLVDPARLCWGLRRVALGRGVRIAERTAVQGFRAVRGGVDVLTAHGTVHARDVVLATNAFPPPLRRLRAWVVPVHDHVLVTEPLTAAQLAAVGWAERQGLTDAGNQFHYYRLTADDRILWGGYDAVYYRGGRTEPRPAQLDASHTLLARHFAQTFPQLDGVRFTHRWSGLIDTTSRFTPAFGTAHGGRLAYAVGYTGLGVGASRFGALVALDLLAGRRTERTTLGLVRRRPVPFPPGPLRNPVVQLTRAALAREDDTGRRGPWLRLLDRFGVGFTS